LFDWALEIAKYGTLDQKKEVHYRYAMTLEDEGRFAEAEKEFVQAGKTMEAVQMYIHSRDWESAEDVARSHSQEAVAQVLIARAAEAAESQDYTTAEALLLRAHKPEMIIEHYKVSLYSGFRGYFYLTILRLSRLLILSIQRLWIRINAAYVNNVLPTFRKHCNLHHQG